jgi:hypothetical protein
MVNKNRDQSELNEIGINEDITVTVYVNKLGEEIEKEDNQSVVAKLINTNGKASFYIKFRRGQLFDPYGIDALKINSRDIRYKKVDLDIYLSYKRYLETRREIFLTEAKRSFIRKGY